MYRKAQAIREYGEMELNNKHLYSFNVGLEYLSSPERTWSFGTGFYIGYEPGYRFNHKIEDKDLLPEYAGNGYLPTTTKYTIVNIAVPFKVEYKIKVGQDIFFNASTGFRMLYFQQGTLETSVSYVNEIGEEVMVFLAYMESPKNSLQGSFQVSSGLYFLFDKTLLQLNLVYNKNFQNILEGEYQFFNLLVSPPTKGKYILSGDFIGLSATVFLKNKKMSKRIKLSQQKSS